jgi:hypothetical protein
LNNNIKSYENYDNFNTGNDTYTKAKNFIDYQAKYDNNNLNYMKSYENNSSFNKVNTENDSYPKSSKVTDHHTKYVN